MKEIKKEEYLNLLLRLRIWNINEAFAHHDKFFFIREELNSNEKAYFAILQNTVLAAHTHKKNYYVAELMKKEHQDWAILEFLHHNSD